MITLQAYDELLKLDPEEDEATHAVAQNNAAAERYAAAAAGSARRMAVDSLKRLDALVERPAAASAGGAHQLKGPLEARMSDAQKEGVHCNRITLLIATGKLEAARELTGFFMKR